MSRIVLRGQRDSYRISSAGFPFLLHLVKLQTISHPTQISVKLVPLYETTIDRKYV